MPGENSTTLGITGREIFSLDGLDEHISPNSQVTVRLIRDDLSVFYFHAIARLNTMIEVDYYRNGGVLNTVLNKMR
jgi:aconitate hydratase